MFDSLVGILLEDCQKMLGCLQCRLMLVAFLDWSILLTIVLMAYSDTDYGWLFKYLLYMWMVGKFEAHFIPEYFITQ